jgi:cyclic dehypoxanthinyl futalosine synthase
MRKVPARRVTFVIDRNINYTNACNAYCTFCAFYRRPGDKDVYVLPDEEVLAKVAELVAIGGTQVLLQGGLNPDLGLDYAVHLMKTVHKAFPQVDLHSFTATEIEHYAKMSDLSTLDVLRALKDAGLKSLPGGGAEILVERVRDRVSPLKTTADAWARIMREAQGLGMPTTATMMYGMVETKAERIEHLRLVRELQDERHGFTAFIPWSFQNDGSAPLKAPQATSDQYLRLIAVSRLYLDNFDHVQSGWVTEGEKTAQIALHMGADDWGGILMEENVISAAGTHFTMTPEWSRYLINDAGFEAAQRNTYYRTLKEFERQNRPPKRTPVPDPIIPGAPVGASP